MRRATGKLGSPSLVLEERLEKRLAQRRNDDRVASLRSWREIFSRGCEVISYEQRFTGSCFKYPEAALRNRYAVSVGTVNGFSSPMPHCSKSLVLRVTKVS